MILYFFIQDYYASFLSVNTALSFNYCRHHVICMHVNMYLVNQFSSDRQNLSSFQILTITISKGPPAKYVCAFPLCQVLEVEFQSQRLYTFNNCIFIIK